jgi:uncharacterized Zn-binding protein involved in type VI secretion
MSDAARETDLCDHPTLVISGSPDTTTGYLPQARLGDHTSPCPLCCTPPPGLIVQGSMSVFVNSFPAVRVGDQIICGAGVLPVPPGSLQHLPAGQYSVRDEDNYVKSVFTDDSALINEPPPKAAPQDLPARQPLSRFLQGLSLDLNVGMRFVVMAMAGGPNSVALGCFSVHIGG